MQAKKIPHVFIALVTNFIMFSSGCEPPDTNRVGSDQGMYIDQLASELYRLKSGDANVIHFGWSAKNISPCDQMVQLELRDDPQTFVRRLAFTFVNLCNGGTSTFNWDGRMPAHGSSGARTIPVPPGSNWRIRVYQGTSYSRWYDATFVANSFDSDSDDFSDAVEDENAGIGGPVTTITYRGNTYYYNRTSNISPPMISTSTPSGDSLYVNRGTRDYSLARGTVSSGRLSNGLRIANESIGYYYFPGMDTPDTDNWGVLVTINAIEWVGRRFRSQYPSGARVGSGDISLQTGGFWSHHPGGTHQRGLDVDLGIVPFLVEF